MPHCTALCQRCAESCAQFTDDRVTQECAEACRRGGDACMEMAA